MAQGIIGAGDKVRILVRGEHYGKIGVVTAEHGNLRKYDWMVRVGDDLLGFNEDEMALIN